MKNLLHLSLAVICFNIYASQQTDITPWRAHFKQLHNVTSEQYSDAHKRWQKLHHNPQITLLEKNDSNVIQQGGPTLFIHGWGGSKDAYTTSRLCASNNIPGDVITFNFKDTTHWIKQTIPYYMPITRSSFAGHEDIVTLLAVVKTLQSTDCLPAVWYPHSRGSGTTMAVIGILNAPSETEQALLQEWDITNENRNTIINAIKIVYLLNPLTNFDIALNKQISARLNIIDTMLPFLRTKIIAPLLKKYILPRLTCYQYNQKNPIDYVSQWQDLQMAVWLHFEENDMDVANEDDVNLTQQLDLILQGGNLYVSCTDNGGHNTYPVFINTITSPFNEANGCSYIQNQEDNNISNVINDAKIDKENNNNNNNQIIENHLHNFSQKYTKRTFWNHRMTQRIFTLCKIGTLSALLYFLNRSSYGILGLKFEINDQFFSIYKV